MNVITNNPILVAGQNDDYSNLSGDSPKADIIAFQNWAVSKGYLPSDKANGKWNVPTDTANDNYGKAYLSEQKGGFRFDMFPSIKSLGEVKTEYPSAGSGKTLPTLKATAERPKSEKKGIGLLGWIGIGAGVLVLGVIAYKISKSKNK